MRPTLLVVPVAAVLCLGLAVPALAAEDPAPSADCVAAEAALDGGQDVLDRRGAAVAALASARADAEALVADLDIEFDVAAATAADVQVAIDEALRPARDAHEVDSDAYVEADGHMLVAKTLRGALVEFSASAEAALVVDLGVLAADRDQACTVEQPADLEQPADELEPAPTAPTTDATAPAPNLPASGHRFDDCGDVIAAGAAPLYAHQDGYRSVLDSDRDGVACEVTLDGYTYDDTNSRTATAIPSGHIDTGR